NASKSNGQNAVALAEQYKTLAEQLATWRSLNNRKELLAQAQQLAKADVAALTDDQARLKAEIEAANNSEKPVVEESSSDRIDRLQRLAVRQNIQSLLSDR